MYPPHGTKYQKEIEERTVVTWSIFEVNSVIACLELIDFVVELFNPLIRISSSQEFPKIETSGQVLRIFNRLTVERYQINELQSIRRTTANIFIVHGVKTNYGAFTH